MMNNVGLFKEFWTMDLVVYNNSMVKLPTQRAVKRGIEKWWGRITSPYLRRQFLEAPRKGIFLKWIRDIMDSARFSVPLPDLKTPFRKLRGLDKKN